MVWDSARCRAKGLGLGVGIGLGVGLGLGLAMAVLAARQFDGSSMVFLPWIIEFLRALLSMLLLQHVFTCTSM